MITDSYTFCPLKGRLTDPENSYTECGLISTHLSFIGRHTGLIDVAPNLALSSKMNHYIVGTGHRRTAWGGTLATNYYFMMMYPTANPRNRMLCVFVPPCVGGSNYKFHVLANNACRRFSGQHLTYLRNLVRTGGCYTYDALLTNFLAAATFQWEANWHDDPHTPITLTASSPNYIVEITKKIHQYDTQTHAH